MVEAGGSNAASAAPRTGGPVLPFTWVELNFDEIYIFIVCF